MAEPAPLSALSMALYTRADVAGLARVLTTTLADLVPAESIVVERRRTTADRIARRAGTVTAITISAGDQHLALRATSGAPKATVLHVVGGVRLSGRDVELGEWIELLAAGLQRQAAVDERAQAAIERFLLE